MKRTKSLEQYALYVILVHFAPSFETARRHMRARGATNDCQPQHSTSHGSKNIRRDGLASHARMIACDRRAINADNDPKTVYRTRLRFTVATLVGTHHAYSARSPSVHVTAGTQQLSWVWKRGRARSVNLCCFNVQVLVSSSRTVAVSA